MSALASRRAHGLAVLNSRDRSRMRFPLAPTWFFALLEAVLAIGMAAIWAMTGHDVFLFLAGCAFGAGATIAAIGVRS